MRTTIGSQSKLTALFLSFVCFQLTLITNDVNAEPVAQGSHAAALAMTAMLLGPANTLICDKTAKPTPPYQTRSCAVPPDAGCIKDDNGTPDDCTDDSLEVWKNDEEGDPQPTCFTCDKATGAIIEKPGFC